MIEDCLAHHIEGLYRRSAHGIPEWFDREPPPGQPFTDARSVVIPVTPTDHAPRTYAVDLRGAPGWSGTIDQLELALATGEPLTGTVRTDYVWLGVMP